MEVRIDEGMLRQIAQITDGQYFRATSNLKLAEIYQEIDQLEKSKIDIKEFSRRSEEFMPFALAGLLLLLAGLFLRITLFRNIP